MVGWMSGRVVLRMVLAAMASACLLLIPASAALASNNGDVWTDNVGQPAGPGNEQDPHLACQDINLWGSGLAGVPKAYTIDGWPPSGNGAQAYGANWNYDSSKPDPQIVDVIPVKTLIENALANGDVAQPNQGFHFKLQFGANPQKHKTFWVNCTVPSIVTHAASSAIGQPITDQAKLSGSNGATGTITWNVYSSSDKSCAKVLGTVSDPVNGDGTYTSPDFNPGALGSYQWVATYSGDPQNLSVSTACNDPNEQSTVSKASPAVSTTAASGTMGQAITDEAILSGGDSPGGSITWYIYSSSDKSCSTVLGTVSKSVNGDGAYTSPGFNPSGPGSYQWVAKYSGDANNAQANTSCNDPNEQSTVTKASPAISTNATSGTAGQPIYDVATLTGGFKPTGTITWNVYPAGSCAAAPLATVSDMVNGDGTYNSPTWTPNAAGTYQWVATYSGDANNSSIATLCKDPNEQSTVQQAPAPGISLIKLESDGSSGSLTHGPITGNVGDTIEYQMTVVNTGNTSLVITFTDAHCDAGTLSAPKVLNGTFDPATSTLSSGGELQYTCSHVLHGGDIPEFANTASVTGQPPQGPPISATDTVVALLNTPGMTVTKLQRDGSSGSFTTGQITAMVGDTIQYEIQVTNTGNTTLALSLSDVHCDAGTIQGPTALSGTLNGSVLSPGGQAQYTCSHVLVSGDVPSFTNVGTITGQPPSGPPLSGSGVVVATVTTAGIHVVKLQRDGSSGAFTSAPITANVGDKIEYEIQVTNTGTAPLTLTLSDPRCDAGTISAPTVISGTLNGTVLSPGGEAQYTCSHVLKAGDSSPFTNTATVSGQPPSGPPVVGVSSVTANKQAVLPVTILRCARGKVKRTKKVHGKTVTVCVKKNRPIISRAPIRPSGFTG